MCDGGVFSVPIAMAIVGAGTAIYQGKQQVKALQKQVNIEQADINDKAAQAANEKLAEVRALRAQARAAAAESVVSGNSLAALESDIEAQGGRDIAQIESNRSKGIASSSVESAARRRVAKAEAISGVATSAVNGANGLYSNITINNTGSAKSK